MIPQICRFDHRHMSLSDVIAMADDIKARDEARELAGDEEQPEDNHDAEIARYEDDLND